MSLKVQFVLREKTFSASICGGSNDEVLQLVSLINAAYDPSDAFFMIGPRISNPSEIDTHSSTYLVIHDLQNPTQPVACVRFKPQPPNSLTFGHLAVLPDYQRFGLGRKVTSLVEEIAIDRGFETLSILVVTAKPWLKEWYEKQGFKQLGDELPWRGPKGILKIHCGFYQMEKDLKK